MFKSKDNSKVTTVIATTPELGPDFPTKVSFTDAKLDASGSFGVVYQARLTETGETVAIKKVAQDRRYRNRELDIMRQLNHTNIVKLKYYYYAQGEKKQMFLCLILEYFPSTLFTLLRQYCRSKRTLPLPYIKVFAYQLFRSLAYLHSIGITHRDVKPPNLLINMETGILKLCDFGSAKHLVKGEPSVSYICSRYYRAPELLFNATEYTAMVDVWSAGCVLVELMLGRAIFVSNNCVSQLVEIMKVLGTPSKDEIWHMNKVYAEYSYPHLDPHPWQEIFNGKASPEAIDLVSRLLVYTPSARITPLQACAHKFFNKLREPGAKLPNGKDLPLLFNFSEHELKIQPNLNSILIPPHFKDNLRSTNDDVGRVVANTSSSTTNNVAASEIQSKNL